MEEIESIKDLLNKRRNLYFEKYTKEEEKQIQEYNDIMKQSKALRVEYTQLEESITKNCINLIGHKHAVQKLLNNSEHTTGLPISHDYHQQTIQFVSDAIDYINNFETSNGPIDILQKDDIDAKKLTDNIITSTNHVRNEFYKGKTALMHIEKVRDNIDIFLEFNFTSDDENSDCFDESNSSYS